MAATSSDRLLLSTQQQQRLESCLRDFVRAWDENRLAIAVSELPPAEDPVRGVTLLELVKLDLERHCQRGRIVPVETYLQNYPDLGTTDNVSAELLLAEYTARCRQGTQADLADYARRFPRQIDALRRLISETQETFTGTGAVPASSDRGVAGPSTLGSGPSAPPPGLLPEQFGRYRIERKLGQGGMGAVYLAHDTQLDRLVALKVPHFTPEDGSSALERFYREGRAAATISHTNICPVYDVGQVGSIHYMTMGYIEGRPLSDWLRSATRLTQPEAASLVRKLALALEEAHQAGVIHRDLKPSNIMIGKRGEPVIMDFGLARRISKADIRLTRSGALLGTPAYMAPEQVSGDVERMGPSCEHYSLGVILYELLTGCLPFQGSLGEVMAGILTQVPAPPRSHRPELDPRLEAICLRALSKRPADRYQTMAEFAVALDEYLGSVPQPVAQPWSGSSITPERAGSLPAALIQSQTVLQPPESPRHSRRLLLPILAGAGVVMALFVGWFLMSGRREGAPPEDSGRAGLPNGLDTSLNNKGTSKEDVPMGPTINLAAAAKGGVLVDVPAQLDDARWAAAHLIDSPELESYEAPGKGAIAAVVGFKGGQSARISEVAVNPCTRSDKANWVREVDIEISDTYPFAGFKPAGTFEVPAVANDVVHAIDPPQVGRYVRFTFRKNGGGGYMDVGEILVKGTLLPDQPAPPELTNFALAQNGGKIVRATSEYDKQHQVAHLIDGSPGQSWEGTSGHSQMVVIQLGRPTDVQFVTVNPYCRDDPSNWAREAEVFLSNSDSIRGFQPVGRIKFEQIGRDHVISLPTPMSARFVKVVFRSNGGGGYMGANEIKVFGKETTNPVPTPEIIDLAAAANDGKVVDAPAEYGNSQTAQHLIAGAGSGSFQAPGKGAISIVVGFKDGKPGKIAAVAVNPYVKDTPPNWVRQVEVEISENSPILGFRSVGVFDVPETADDGVLTLDPPQVARYVRFSFLKNGGGGYVGAGKVMVLGSLLAEAPPAAAWTNFALARDGARIVRGTSEYDSGYKLASLIETNPSSSWLGASVASQSVVIQLGQPARVTALAVNPYVKDEAPSWVSEVEFLVSSSDAVLGFHSVGRLTLKPVGCDQVLELKTPEPARYVKVRFLRNGGGNYLGAHKVKVLGTPVALPLPAGEAQTNLVAAANGGTLVDVPAQYNETWAAKHLIDTPGHGCFATPDKNPLSVVLGFKDGQAGQISALAINPYSSSDLGHWVRQVQVEVSQTYAFTGFQDLGTFDIPLLGDEAVFPLAVPKVGRYVRFTFLKNDGHGDIELNEVMVIGKLMPGVTAPPELIDVALAKNGGKIVKVTSEYNKRDWSAPNLIAGSPGKAWSSADKASQEVVIQLGKPALVRHVAINPYSSENPSSWARTAEIFVSGDAAGPFKSVGKIDMGEIARDYARTLDKPEEARFVKILFLTNGGGNYITAHQVKVFGTVTER